MESQESTEVVDINERADQWNALLRERNDIIDRLRRPVPKGVRSTMRLRLQDIDAELDTL